MDFELCLGDRLELKKQHPCGGRVFTVQRVGMDIRLECESCGRSILVPRRRAEGFIKRRL